MDSIYFHLLILLEFTLLGAMAPCDITEVPHRSSMRHLCQLIVGQVAVSKSERENRPQTMIFPYLGSCELWPVQAYCLLA
jgi:hypothetical protein